MAVIVVLMAIVVPVIAMIQRAAHTTQCMSNLRQVSGSCMTYAPCII